MSRSLDGNSIAKLLGDLGMSSSTSSSEEDIERRPASDECQITPPSKSLQSPTPLSNQEKKLPMERSAHRKKNPRVMLTQLSDYDENGTLKEPVQIASSDKEDDKQKDGESPGDSSEILQKNIPKKKGSSDSDASIAVVEGQKKNDEDGCYKQQIAEEWVNALASCKTKEKKLPMERSAHRKKNPRVVLTQLSDYDENGTLKEPVQIASSDKEDDKQKDGESPGDSSEILQKNIPKKKGSSDSDASIAVVEGQKKNDEDGCYKQQIAEEWVNALASCKTKVLGTKNKILALEKDLISHGFTSSSNNKRSNNEIVSISLPSTDLVNKLQNKIKLMNRDRMLARQNKKFTIAKTIGEVIEAYYKLVHQIEDSQIEIVTLSFEYYDTSEEKSKKQSNAEVATRNTSVEKKKLPMKRSADRKKNAQVVLTLSSDDEEDGTLKETVQIGSPDKEDDNEKDGESIGDSSGSEILPKNKRKTKGSSDSDASIAVVQKKKKKLPMKRSADRKKNAQGVLTLSSDDEEDGTLKEPVQIGSPDKEDDNEKDGESIGDSSGSEILPKNKRKTKGSSDSDASIAVVQKKKKKLPMKRSADRKKNAQGVLTLSSDDEEDGTLKEPVQIGSPDKEDDNEKDGESIGDSSGSEILPKNKRKTKGSSDSDASIAVVQKKKKKLPMKRSADRKKNAQGVLTLSSDDEEDGTLKEPVQIGSPDKEDDNEKDRESIGDSSGSEILPKNKRKTKGSSDSDASIAVVQKKKKKLPMKRSADRKKNAQGVLTLSSDDEEDGTLKEPVQIGSPDKEDDNEKDGESIGDSSGSEILPKNKRKTKGSSDSDASIAVVQKKKKKLPMKRSADRKKNAQGVLTLSSDDEEDGTLKEPVQIGSPDKEDDNEKYGESIGDSSGSEILPKNKRKTKGSSDSDASIAVVQKKKKKLPMKRSADRKKNAQGVLTLSSDDEEDGTLKEPVQIGSPDKEDDNEKDGESIGDSSGSEILPKNKRKTKGSSDSDASIAVVQKKKKKLPMKRSADRKKNAQGVLTLSSDDEEDGTLKEPVQIGSPDKEDDNEKDGESIGDSSGSEILPKNKRKTKGSSDSDASIAVVQKKKKKLPMKRSADRKKNAQGVLTLSSDDEEDGTLKEPVQIGSPDKEDDNEKDGESIGDSSGSEILPKNKRKTKGSSDSDASIAVVQKKKLLVSDKKQPKNVAGPKTKRNWCRYCKSFQSKIGRHFANKHKDVPEVKDYLSITDTDKKKERKSKREACRSLIKLSNKEYNDKIVNQQLNETPIPVKKGINKPTALSHVVCDICAGLFSKKHFSTHKLMCKGMGDNIIPKCSFLVPNLDEKYEVLFKKVLSHMKKDEISLMAHTDKLILEYGRRFLRTHMMDKQRNSVASKMRTLASLVLRMKKRVPSLSQLSDCLDAVYFDQLCDAVREWSGYDEWIGTCEKGSVPRRIIKSIKVCSNLLVTKAVKDKRMTDIEKKDVKKKHKEFMTLIDSDWRDEVNSAGDSSLKSMKISREDIVPLEADLKSFFNKIIADVEKLCSNLDDTEDKNVYNALVQNLIVFLIAFNCRRPNEVTYATTQDYTKLEQTPNDSNLSVFYVAATKNDLKVPVIVPDTIRVGIDKIIKFREFFKIPGNLIFSKDDGTSYQGSSLLSKFKKEVTMKKPEYFTANGLRHYWATITQKMPSLKAHMPKFLGHTTLTHEKFYEKQCTDINLKVIGPALMENCIRNNKGGITNTYPTTSQNQPKPGTSYEGDKIARPRRSNSIATYESDSDNLDDPEKMKSTSEDSSENDSVNFNIRTKKRWATPEKKELYEGLPLVVLGREQPGRGNVKKLYENSKFLKKRHSLQTTRIELSKYFTGKKVLPSPVKNELLKKVSCSQ